MSDHWAALSEPFAADFWWWRSDLMRSGRPSYQYKARFRRKDGKVSIEHLPVDGHRVFRLPDRDADAADRANDFAGLPVSFSITIRDFRRTEWIFPAGFIGPIEEYADTVWSERWVTDQDGQNWPMLTRAERLFTYEEI